MNFGGGSTTESAVGQAPGAPASGNAAIGVLEAQHLQRSYGKRQVVRDVSLAVRTGEVVGLLGPNGAGKTTSFYMIVGLLRASAGQITIDGQRIEHMPIHRRARRRAVTRQESLMGGEEVAE